MKGSFSPGLSIFYDNPYSDLVAAEHFGKASKRSEGSVIRCKKCKSTRVTLHNYKDYKLCKKCLDKVKAKEGE